MSLPSIVGILGIATGISVAAVGLVFNARQASRHEGRSAVGIRLQLAGLAVLVLTFGIDVVLAAAGLGEPLAIGVGLLMLLVGAGVVLVAARVRVRG